MYTKDLEPQTCLSHCIEVYRHPIWPKILKVKKEKVWDAALWQSACPSCREALQLQNVTSATLHPSHWIKAWLIVTDFTEMAIYPGLQFLLHLFTYLLCTQRSACMYACKPEEGTRSQYRWRSAIMRSLEIELRTSGRAVIVLTNELSPQPPP